jgi:uncharacterized membrane protein
MITAPHLHAMVIHFPIALLLAGFLSELIALVSKNPFFKNASLYLLILGTLGAIVAFVSGSNAGDGMTDGISKTYGNARGSSISHTLVGHYHLATQRCNVLF